MTRPCVISEGHLFIYVLLPKNASSTLRTEFRQERYRSTTGKYSAIPAQKRKDYFTFCLIRDPVARFLSAYQELSMRYDMGEIDIHGREFFSFDDTEYRINSMLDYIWEEQWDPHIKKQVDLLEGVDIDFFASVEWLQQDMEHVFRLLDMGPCPKFPQRRSRLNRQATNTYSKFLWFEDQLEQRTVDRIKLLYQDDIDLFQQRVVGRYVADGDFLRRSPP